MLTTQLTNILNNTLKNPIYKTIQMINIKKILRDSNFVKQDGAAVHLIVLHFVYMLVMNKAYFETIEQREAFIVKIESDGFKVKELIETNTHNSMIGIGFYRQDKPFYYDIDALSLHLIDLSHQCGGQYDGWETSVVKI